MADSKNTGGRKSHIPPPRVVDDTNTRSRRPSDKKRPVLRVIEEAAPSQNSQTFKYEIVPGTEDGLKVLTPISDSPAQDDAFVLHSSLDYDSREGTSPFGLANPADADASTLAFAPELWEDKTPLRGPIPGTVPVENPLKRPASRVPYHPLDIAHKPAISTSKKDPLGDLATRISDDAAYNETLFNMRETIANAAPPINPFTGSDRTEFYDPMSPYLNNTLKTQKTGKTNRRKRGTPLLAKTKAVHRSRKNQLEESWGTGFSLAQTVKSFIGTKATQFLQQYKRSIVTTGAVAAAGIAAFIGYSLKPAPAELTFSKNHSVALGESTVESRFVELENGERANLYSVSNFTGLTSDAKGPKYSLTAIDRNTGGQAPVDFRETTLSDIQKNGFDESITLDELIIRSENNIVARLNRDADGTVSFSDVDESLTKDNFNASSLFTLAKKNAAYVQMYAVIENTRKKALFENDPQMLAKANSALKIYSDSNEGTYAAAIAANPLGYELMTELFANGLGEAKPKVTTTQSAIAAVDETKPVSEQQTLATLSDPQSNPLMEAYTAHKNSNAPLVAANVGPQENLPFMPTSKLVMPDESARDLTAAQTHTPLIASNTQTGLPTGGLVENNDPAYASSQNEPAQPIAQVSKPAVESNLDQILKPTFDELRRAYYAKAGGNHSDNDGEASRLANADGFTLSQLTRTPNAVLELNQENPFYNSIASLLGKEKPAVVTQIAQNTTDKVGQPTIESVTPKVEVDPQKHVEKIWAFGGEDGSYVVHRSGDDLIATAEETRVQGFSAPAVGGNKKSNVRKLYDNQTSAMGISAREYENTFLKQPLSRDVTSDLDRLVANSPDVKITSYTRNDDAGLQTFDLKADSPYAQARFLLEQVKVYGADNVLVDNEAVDVQTLQAEVAKYKPVPRARSVGKEGSRVTKNLSGPSVDDEQFIPALPQEFNDGLHDGMVLPPLDNTPNSPRNQIADVEPSALGNVKSAESDKSQRPYDFMFNPEPTDMEYYAQKQFEGRHPIYWEKEYPLNADSTAQEAAAEFMNFHSEFEAVRNAAYKVGITEKDRSANGEVLLPSTVQDFAELRYSDSSYAKLREDVKKKKGVTDLGVLGIEAKIGAGESYVDDNPYDGKIKPLVGDFYVNTDKVLDLVKTGIKRMYGDNPTWAQEDAYVRENVLLTDGTGVQRSFTGLGNLMSELPKVKQSYEAISKTE